MITIGVPREIKENEGRVALLPEHVASLTNGSYAVSVQHNAGLIAGFSDAMYLDAGARILASAEDVYAAGLVLKVKEPLPEEFPLLRDGQMIFTYLHLAATPELLEALLTKKITGIDYGTVRTLDGKLPLLAPMSEVTGRISIQIGAHLLEQHHGEGMGTLLSGTESVPGGNVVILGGGTVGSYAAHAAYNFGANVLVLEKNPERVRELKKQFKKSPRVQIAVSSPELIVSAVKTADLLIGAVLVPGGKAPILVSEDMVRTMKRSAVIIDVAIDQGGCVATSRPTTHANPTVRIHGVVHYAVPNIPSLVPQTSTRALTQATFPYVLLLAKYDLVDAARMYPPLAEGINTYGGHVTHPRLAKDSGKPYMPLSKLI